MTEWTKEKVAILAAHERAGMARTRILDAQKRIEELLGEVAQESEKRAKAFEDLREQNEFLKSKGEEPTEI